MKGLHRTLLAAGAATFVGAFGCTAILGVTDVPIAAAPIDASTEATVDADTAVVPEASTDASTCTAGGGACDNTTTAPGQACCSKLCLQSAVSGTCGAKQGTYSLQVNGGTATNISTYYDVNSMLTIIFKLPNGTTDAITITLYQVDTGCATDRITFLSSLAQYLDDGSAACGLVVSGIAPGTLQGRFAGTLTSGAQSVTVSLTFTQPLS